jgi:hypothetical protein
MWAASAPLSIYLWPNISGWSVRRICIKFGTVGLYEWCGADVGFLKIRAVNAVLFLRTEIKCLPYCRRFYLTWINLYIVCGHKNVFNYYSFVKHRYSESWILLTDVNKFVCFSSKFMFRLGEIWYKTSAHNAVEHCELCEYQRQEFPAFLMGPNTITFVLVPRKSMTFWK